MSSQPAFSRSHGLRRLILQQISLAAVAMLLVPSTFAADSEQGYLELFRDDAYGSSKMTVRFGEQIPDFRQVKWDDASDNIHDKVSSYRFVIPDGWELQLCIDTGYGQPFAVRGRGELAKLHNLSDKLSSLRWTRIPEQD